MCVRRILVTSSSITLRVPIKRPRKRCTSNVADTEARRLRAAGVDAVLAEMLGGDFAASVANAARRDA